VAFAAYLAKVEITITTQALRIVAYSAAESNEPVSVLALRAVDVIFTPRAADLALLALIADGQVIPDLAGDANRRSRALCAVLRTHLIGSDAPADAEQHEADRSSGRHASRENLRVSHYK